MAIRLLSWPQSSGSRIQWALEELGLPYEYERIDRDKMEHKSPEYRAINPNGKVPALVDDGEPYFESLAILLHLAEKYGTTKGLWPARGTERAEALSWTVWAATELWAYMIQYLYHGLDTPISFAKAQRSKAAGAWSRANFSQHLDMLEQRLQGRNYVMGSAFTLVDLPIASVLRFGTRFGASIDGRPNVGAWLARCVARPALQRVE